jgi:S1-C subfamily serine protease
VVLWQNLPLGQKAAQAPPGQPPAAPSPAPATPSPAPAAPSPALAGPVEVERPATTEQPPAAASVVGLAADEKATIQLFKAASPSVVHITTNVLERSFFSMNVMETPRGTGTGFVWDDQGHIVTNFHVIEDADTAQVGLADHSAWPAKLVGVAPDKDLAVLKIDAPADRLQALPLGSSRDLQVGQRALAIGNPFGLDQTLTTGTVSALEREIASVTGRPIRGVIQTDAAINPGNSGGPLLDSSGRLIGMTTTIVSPSGAYAGIGFAIPVDTINWGVPQLIAHGKIIRPTLAIAVAPDSLTEEIGVAGVLVLSVGPNSAAAKAGLRPTRRDGRGNMELGDIIVAIDGFPIRSTSDLLDSLERFKVGDEATLTVIRNRQKAKVRVPLEASD